MEIFRVDICGISLNPGLVELEERVASVEKAEVVELLAAEVHKEQVVVSGHSLSPYDQSAVLLSTGVNQFEQKHLSSGAHQLSHCEFCSSDQVELVVCSVINVDHLHEELLLGLKNEIQHHTFSELRIQVIVDDLRLFDHHSLA
jgi:hypothetical protein